MDAEVTSTGSGILGGVLRRRKPRRLSEVFSAIARDANGDVSIGTIRDKLGDRSFAALLVFFAAINLIPVPPGASAFLGLPLLIVSLQMVYGSKRVWLPQVLTNRSISAGTFRSIMDRVLPRLIWIEQMIKPRYWPFRRRRGDRVIGIIALIMAVSITLPIPLGNWPPAFSTALLGLALSERDGILFALGGLAGVIAMAIVAFVVGAAGVAAQAVFRLDHVGTQPSSCLCARLISLRHQCTSLLAVPASSDNKRHSRRSGNARLRQRGVCCMADLIIVYWRDIPAQVIVRKGRQNAKRELPLRFTEAIDMAAMRSGAAETDAYLAEWRKADPVPVGDDLEAEAEKAADALDAKYDRERLVALVKAGGKENV